MSSGSKKKGLSKRDQIASNLSREQILEEIAKTVNKEKNNRLNKKKLDEKEIFMLQQSHLKEKSPVTASKPMSKSLATLKSLIRSIVREEIKRLSEPETPLK